MTVFAQNVVIELNGNTATVSRLSVNGGIAATIPISKDSGGFPIKTLEIAVSRSIEDANLTIEVRDSKPAGLADVQGSVYKYLSIRTTIPLENILYAKIVFGVPSAWMAQNQDAKNAVGVLGEAKGDWSLVSFAKNVNSTTSDEVLFLAEMQNLSSSNYAISGRLAAADNATVGAVTKTMTVTTSQTTVTSTPVITTTITTIIQGDDTFTYIAVGVAVVATIVLLAVIRSKQT